MPNRGFIGRQGELAVLRRELARERPSLLVVFGRRRVGKSTLLVEATRERRTIYYQASRITASDNLALFKAEAARVLGGGALLDTVSDWHGMLAVLELEARASPGLTVVLDEFPYLCEPLPGLPSIVQKFWDGVRSSGTKLNLVLCGSKISFMEELLAERNPLHGRQTLELDLGPLSYREAAEFFDGWPVEDRFYAYGIFGGVPYYLDLCDPAASLRENVHDLVLARGAPLSDEPNHLLQAELQTVTRFSTILRAVADGCTDSGSIINRVAEIRDAGQLAPYIQKLQGLRLIRVVQPLDASERERDRRYYLDDPFLAFWYRFCLPNLSALAAGHGEEVYRLRIAPRLDEHMGGIFEWICRDYMRLYGQEVLGVPAATVGQIWAADFDLDVVGSLLDGTTFFGECKWRKSPVGTNVLDHLVETAGRSRYPKQSPQYLLFARKGFTDALKALDTPGVFLLDLPKLLAP